MITLKQAAAWCGGRVAEEFADLCFSGAQFDSRNLRQGELFVALSGARDGHDFVPVALEKGAAAVLASKPLDSEVPVIYVDDTLKALQAISKGYRESLSAMCVGITGSVGKTTTKEMVAAVLGGKYRTQKTPQNFNNDIGLPVTLLGLREDCEAAVLEMGMNHRGEISVLTALAQPDIAVITNVGTMHIEHLGSRENILQAKLEMLEGLRPDGKVIFCGDNDLLWREAKTYGAVCYGFEAHNDLRALEVQTADGVTTFVAEGMGERFSVVLPTVGNHHVLNALAAIAVGLLCQVPVQAMQTGLATFRNTGMRQNIYRQKGLCIVEDCYNAGPESMAAALQVLAQQEGRKIAVLGGMLELGGHAPEAHRQVGQLAAQSAELLFAYGEQKENYLLGAAGMPYARGFDSHEELAQALLEQVQPEDCLLFKGSRGMHMERVLRLFLDNYHGGDRDE